MGWPSEPDCLYSTLQVGRDATGDEIRRSFKQLVRDAHPDKGGDPEIFRKIHAAYTVLSDPLKREQYDKFGFDGVDDNLNFRTRPFDEVMEELRAATTSWATEDLAKREQQAASRRQSLNVTVPLELTLEEFYKGCSKALHFPVQRPCTNCDAANTSKLSCGLCMGRGTIERIFAVGGSTMAKAVQCNACQGTGLNGGGSSNRRDGHCSQCQSSGRVTMKQRKTVTVAAGMLPLTKFKFPKCGHQLEVSGECGDAIIVLKEKKHATFTRKRNDLAVMVPITLAESLGGFDCPLQHIDGSWLMLSSSPGEIIKPNSLRKVKGKGFPIYSGGNHKSKSYGSLYVRFFVEFPSKLQPSLASEVGNLLASFFADSANEGQNESHSHERKHSTLATRPNLPGGTKGIHVRMEPAIGTSFGSANAKPSSSSIAAAISSHKGSNGNFSVPASSSAYSDLAPSMGSSESSEDGSKADFAVPGLQEGSSGGAQDAEEAAADSSGNVCTHQ